MDIAKILLSLIMTGLAASLVFVNLELKEVRSNISRIEAKVCAHDSEILSMANKMVRLVELHQPQSALRNQATQELKEIIDRYIKITLS